VGKSEIGDGAEKSGERKEKKKDISFLNEL
jgi:hypothetical protein